MALDSTPLCQRSAPVQQSDDEQHEGGDQQHMDGGDPRSYAPQHAAIADACLCVCEHVQMAESVARGQPIPATGSVADASHLRRSPND